MVLADLVAALVIARQGELRPGIALFGFLQQVGEFCRLRDRRADLRHCRRAQRHQRQ
jgi:hypothetical protein